MKVIEVIKKFFEADDGKKITMDELKALTKEERRELAELAGAELGVEVE